MEIKTERLVMKPYSETDENDMIALLTNECIKATYMIPDFKTKDDAIAMFRRLYHDSHSDDHLEIGIYRNNKLIGFLNDVEMNEDIVELGYVIHPDFHGLGYATEALKAVIEKLFEMGYQEVITGAFETNTASIRVMQKCNMHLLSKTEDIRYHQTMHHCVYYFIRRT
ncbi:MAG: GNAT family N-acetyltransferase [Lachnospiraceae bacterium]|nr:GNAT family N-acetyltransferase [Lachnospiraceae bacterium]